MYIHEYQAKAILARYGLPLPQGELVETAEAASAVAARLPGRRWAVKAQILAGGRGRAGGVRIVEEPETARQVAQKLLGQRMVTARTVSGGSVVRRLYVEEAVEHDRGLYAAILVDQASGRVALIGARSGGEDIEERTARDPALIQKALADPLHGFAQADLAVFARSLALEGALAERSIDVFARLYRAFVDLDASLIEINPLAITPQRDLTALDVKMAFDDNALFRHPELAALRDPAETDPVELEAQRYEINYVKLEGNIGLVANGAGLGLATLDMVKDAGGAPANFMDIRPEATSTKIATGLALLLANPNVQALLVNLYGGGLLTCDTVAEGLALALRRSPRKPAIIFRAAGSNADLAYARLRNYGIPHIAAADMMEAVDAAVANARRAA